MKKISMKKAAALLTAVALIVSAFACFGCVSASADSHFVSMYLCDLYYGKHSAHSRNVYIKTDANASSQQVYVHYETGEPSVWEDAEAEFVETLSDGSKLWKANFTSWSYKFEYAIKYVADGNTYWDNNNGSNYTTETLGSAPVTAVRAGSPSAFCSATETITANLQNYSYHKNVFVRYTNDNWNTYTDVPMSYSETLANGTENWTGVIDVIDRENLEFCICYQVNGQEYWANNFGRNYNDSYYMSH